MIVRFGVCTRVFLCSQPILVQLNAQWIAGSQGEGGDAFVAVGPHVIVVHLIHPHGRLVQDTCRTKQDTEGHATEFNNTTQMCNLTHTQGDSIQLDFAYFQLFFSQFFYITGIYVYL